MVHDATVLLKLKDYGRLELIYIINGAVYVVFGAAGAVGSDLVSRLSKQQGASIVASDRDQEGLDQVKLASEILPADTRDEAAVYLYPLTSCFFACTDANDYLMVPPIMCAGSTDPLVLMVNALRR